VNTSRLSLSAGGVVVDLGDHLDRHPSGGAAVLDDGLDGLGLPPVSPRFFDGAGDGSTYRGTRVQPRDVTLPVLLTAPDRRALRERVSALATVLSPAHAPAVLTYTEPDGTEWTTAVVRTASGSPVTDGETHYALEITLRAPDPYWIREQAASKTIESGGAGRGLLRPGGSLSALRLASGQVIGEAVIENPGDAPAYPVVTLTGPATSYELTSPSGERISWSGSLAEGERRVFDHHAGTLVDGDGVNRYAELGASPRFWAIPPGVLSAHVDVTGSSVGSVVPVDPPLRTNLIPDPRLTDQAAWAPGPGGVLSAADDEEGLLLSAVGGATATARPVGDWHAGAGQRVAARLTVHNPGPTPFEASLRVDAVGTSEPLEALGGTGRVPVPAGTSVVLAVIGTLRTGPVRLAPVVELTTPAAHPEGAGPAGVLREAVLLVGDGAPATLPVPYFDGGTAATQGRAYAWSDAPHASASVERATAIVGRTSVSVAWKPRRWFML
jgi:hypothetical protein